MLSDRPSKHIPQPSQIQGAVAPPVYAQNQGSFRKLRVLDLFSGIGGFSLGLERTGGFETVAFCEIDPFCRRVLAKHWPNVPCFEDVTKLRGKDVGSVDVIAGGFPCQDVSSAGQRAGLDGERSGLWAEYARLIGEIRPSIAIVENVSDLRHRGLGDVLGDLVSLGYDCEWHCIPAAAANAHHLRDRIWIVAYTNGGRVCGVGADAGDGGAIQAQGLERIVHRSDSRQGALADADCKPLVGIAVARQERAAWPAEPIMDRVVDGISRELVEPRLKALGNAVVPQVVELIGRAILALLQPEPA
jgi:DNA (cytosine-5)-methyltransferase 1